MNSRPGRDSTMPGACPAAVLLATAACTSFWSVLLNSVQTCRYSTAVNGNDRALNGCVQGSSTLGSAARLFFHPAVALPVRSWWSGNVSDRSTSLYPRS